MYPTCSYSLQARKAIEIASRLVIDPASWHCCSLKNAQVVKHKTTIKNAQVIKQKTTETAMCYRYS
jgi:hypothetical protein